MRAALRQTLRSLRRSPGFVLAVVATVGLGIGLNAAIFTVVDCVLLRPLGYYEADSIVSLRTHILEGDREGDRTFPRLGGDDYRDAAQKVHGLAYTAWYQDGKDAVALDGQTLYLPVAEVGPHFGEVMGVEPLAGRLFNTTDAAGSTALVSAAFAREHFASVAAALGRNLQWTGAPRTIVGVLPDGFAFPGQTSVWFGAGLYPAIGNRTAYNQQAIGRRRRGVSEQQLSAELATFSTQLQRAYPEDQRKTIGAVSLQEQIVGSLRPTLRLLMGSVAVILLLVCANVTHLQLVRATRQTRSATLALALGARRASLALRALSEAVLLACAGLVAAILVAVPALRLLVRLAPEDTARLREIHLNAEVLLSTFAASLLLMTFTAMLPIWRSWHLQPAAVLRQALSRSTEGRGALRLRNGFVVAQVALTLALSIAALLLTRQLIQQSRQDLGFAPDHLITLDTHAVLPGPAPAPAGPSAASQAAGRVAWDRINQANLARLDAVLASTAAIPGVRSVGAINGAPMTTNGSNVSFAVQGRQSFGPGAVDLPIADIFPITPGALSTLGVPLLHGRLFTPSDGLHAPRVVLISESLARLSFPGEDPLGKKLINGFDEDMSGREIVGVVGDMRQSSPAAAPGPTIYVPVAQHPGSAPDMQLLVRTRAEAASMTGLLRKRLAETHPDIAVRATTMTDNIGTTERTERFRTTLFASFAAASILLAALGMYGVTSYTVAQRTFEFGLRMAVGATRAQVLLFVLRRALAPAAFGLALGVGLSLGMSRLLGSVVGRLPTFDTGAYFLASLVIIVVAAAANLVPALRATQVDPMQALRTE